MRLDRAKPLKLCGLAVLVVGLHFEALGVPGVEFFGCFDRYHATHAVMAIATELGAGDFETAIGVIHLLTEVGGGHGGGEAYADSDTRDGVLLHPKFGDGEAMDDVST